jgi:hypothetical protein
MSDTRPVPLSPKARRFTIIACERERDRLLHVSRSCKDEDVAADAANDGMYYDSIIAVLRAAERGT